MRFSTRSVFLIVAALLPLTSVAQDDATESEPLPETASEDAAPGYEQADVWSVVEAQWNAEEKGERDWVEELLVDEFSGWANDSPAPRTKASTKMWDRYTDSLGSMQAHELYPLAIIVRGDTAIAHYLYSSAYEDKDGETEITHGRFTDVLVRTDDGWKFIAWHGGDD